ncbi:peptide ABC transporter substrate-binding protein [Apilactobacillus micheneri]|uniref:peptide ABC transporter substrate-binding protein n=1 Tax=Apilactobacillus micheneri TaxID=1899430 RepID=UPI0011279FF1|nr:peptide ABC transporter substrate-binding protein [Apilactobacillus micheneri]TPR45501.1 peptide ABC transporter substrate-binding protein [Apilactobacillus micheneri]TPR48947.1 peptide ABC transporter substrate-binding protein [Apilactobacillus micheneri]
MKLRSMLEVGAVGAASAFLLVACGNNSGKESSSKLVQWQQSANLTTLDSSKATDVTAAGTLNNSNEGLLMSGENNTVKPGVAENYKVSKDGKTYTFNLRHSKWSNGKPVTAKDFVYGWQRTVNPKTASQYSYLFDHVKNATEIGKNKAPLSSLGVKADGDYKLVVSLTKPQTYFKYLVAMYPFYPQSEAVVNKYGNSYGTNSNNMIYNGPFKVTGWTGTNDSWKLVKNADYWNAKNIKFDGVKFNVQKDPNTALNQYQTGGLDVDTLSGKQQVNEFKNSKELHNNNVASTFYIEMNEKTNPVFRNANIRKAISLAVDRKQFTQDVLGDGSKPAVGYVSPGMSKRNGKDFTDDAGTKEGVSYNLAEAKKLWAKGLKETGKKSVNVSMLSDDTSAGKNTTEYLQTALEKLPNLKVTAQNIPFKSRLSRSQNGQFDMVVSAWGADFPDPVSYLSLFTSDSAYNNGKWSNKEYDALVQNAEGKDSNNAGKRWDDLVRAEKLLMSDQGIIPIYHQVQPIVIKSRVQGIQFFPTGSPYNLRNITLSNK